MSLKEIAHRAGTSVSTVSRVLNQPDYKCKNPELEARIWAAAQEISYTPNTAAQTLKSGAPQIKTTPLTFDIFLTRFPSLSEKRTSTSAMCSRKVSHPPGSHFHVKRKILFFSNRHTR